ncbi:Era Like 12S Mitochondrial RRNA Chaperone 1 [Linnemannia gamsii]|uniref:Era Like 12S Mitochondrial RRNA Chaperone 1 n=1 Tax=Linnemannia gamsii TaxID=64522 RepID=A0ABQ7KBD2_9FUNG|nr:Era Like 12S Mitochondrial RRNA Chaperone 1 [Linnemannia gamsii]
MIPLFRSARVTRLAHAIPANGQHIATLKQGYSEAQRFFATKHSKSSPSTDMDPSSKSLELLRRTLQEKRAKLQEITERQAPLAPTASNTRVISSQEIESPSTALEQTSTSNAQQQPAPTPRHRTDRAMPIFASPADMYVRLPKVARNFSQPENPEIVKIALIGSPNVGKSTIVNDLVKSTVSIVSVRPHTTRERIKAVLTQDNKQIVFYDTPGVVPEKNVSRLNRELVTASWKAIEDADHLLVVMDCNKLLEHSLVTEAYIFERLAKLEKPIPATLVFNKMDLVKGRNDKIQEFAAKYNEQFPNFVKTIYTSAQQQKIGIQELRSHLMSLTHPGPWLYPANQKSDQSDLNRVEDLIRSELFGLLKVPYHIKQVNVGWTELEDNVLRIDQNLLVDRPGLKKIIVGTDGAVIRDLTLKSRQLIGKALQRRVMLNLQVKVNSKKV